MVEKPPDGETRRRRSVQIVRLYQRVLGAARPQRIRQDVACVGQPAADDEEVGIDDGADDAQPTARGALTGARFRVFPLYLSGYPSRSAMCSPTRKALAMIVRVGLTAPIEGKKLASVT